MTRKTRCACCGELHATTKRREFLTIKTGWNKSRLCDFCLRQIIEEFDTTIRERIEKARTA